MLKTKYISSQFFFIRSGTSGNTLVCTRLDSSCALIRRPFLRILKGLYFMQSAANSFTIFLNYLLQQTKGFNNFMKQNEIKL